MSELLVRKASAAAPLQTPERIKLGRILHLDRSLSRTHGKRLEVHVFLHSVFAMLAGPCAVGLYEEPENAVLGFFLYLLVLTWIGTTFIMESLIRWNAAYE